MLYKTILRLPLLSALLTSYVDSLPTCSSDRPGGESHRTLYVADFKLQGGAKDDVWANVLCCVYTHVTVSFSVDPPVISDTMELYDGSDIDVKANNFETMAQLAFELICDMSMGSEDCSNQRACIDSALAIATPTQSPTISVTSSMTSLPSDQPVDAPSASPAAISSSTPSSQAIVQTCDDSSYRFKVSKNGRDIWRDCFWVMNRATKSRCKLEGVKTICPKTCATCSNCIDASPRMKFEKSDGSRITRNCQWTANKNTMNRCKLDGMATTCRKTCGMCPGNDDM